MSDSLRLHGLQHTRPPCPSPTPGVYPRVMSIESVMPSSHLILCHPLLLLPPIPPSIRVFSSELALHMRWPKYWSFSFSISPSNEHPGLISSSSDICQSQSPSMSLSHPFSPLVTIGLFGHSVWWFSLERLDLGPTF